MLRPASPVLNFSALGLLTLALVACGDRVGSPAAQPSSGAPTTLAVTATAQTCPAWNAGTVYTAQMVVSDNGVFYRANWWTLGDVPATHNGSVGSGQPWTIVGACSTVNPPPVNPPPVNPPPVNPPPVNPPPVGPPPANGVARHALIGYWHNFDNGSGIFPLGQVSGDWDVIMVAFADSAPAGNVGFTLDPGAESEAQFIADIRAKQAQGKKVVLSLGGANGVISVGSQAEANNFASSLYAIISRYGFDGIDLDLENGVSQGAPIQTYMPVAVKQLKARLGANFYLSMAPEWVYVEGGYTTYGGIWGAYLPIIEALRADLTLLHPQYYNNGAVYTPYSVTGLVAGSTDQLVATAKMLIEGFRYGPNTFVGLRPDQVGFGVPSGPSSAGSGFTTPANVNSALDCLTRLVNCGAIRPKQAYPTFRGVMTWSINWDRHDGFAFSVPVSSKLRSLP